MVPTTERFYSYSAWDDHRSHDTEADAKGTKSTEENIKTIVEHISMCDIVNDDVIIFNNDVIVC